MNEEVERINAILIPLVEAIQYGKREILELREILKVECRLNNSLNKIIGLHSIYVVGL